MNRTKICKEADRVGAKVFMKDSLAGLHKAAGADPVTADIKWNRRHPSNGVLSQEVCIVTSAIECPWCKGTGKNLYDPGPCPACMGAGSKPARSERELREAGRELERRREG